MAAQGITLFDWDTDATIKYVARRTCDAALDATAKNETASPSFARQVPYQAYGVGGELLPVDMSDLTCAFQHGTYGEAAGEGLRLTDYQPVSAPSGKGIRRSGRCGSSSATRACPRRSPDSRGGSGARNGTG
jgi:hypothetical protein